MYVVSWQTEHLKSSVCLEMLKSEEMKKKCHGSLRINHKDWLSLFVLMKLKFPSAQWQWNNQDYDQFCNIYSNQIFLVLPRSYHDQKIIINRNKNNLIPESSVCKGIKKDWSIPISLLLLLWLLLKSWLLFSFPFLQVSKTDKNLLKTWENEILHRAPKKKC